MVYDRENHVKFCQNQQIVQKMRWLLKKTVDLLSISNKRYFYGIFYREKLRISGPVLPSSWFRLAHKAGKMPVPGRIAGLSCAVWRVPEQFRFAQEL